MTALPLFGLPLGDIKGVFPLIPFFLCASVFLVEKTPHLHQYQLGHLAEPVSGVASICCMCLI